MTTPKDLKQTLLNATSSTESLVSLYPELMHYLSQSSDFPEKHMKELISAFHDMIILKTSSPIQKFYGIYLLLRASDKLNKESFMSKLAKDDELLTEIFKIAQFDLNKDILQNERGKTYFGKPSNKAQQEFGINFVRLCYETLLHWGSKYGSSDSKDPFHIYHLLAETLRKKGKLPFKFNFIEKDYDVSCNLTTWNFRDSEPPTYKEPFENASSKPIKIEKQFSFSPEENGPESKTSLDNEDFEEADKTIELEFPDIQLPESGRKSIRPQELTNMGQTPKLTIPNFKEINSPEEGTKLREKMHIYNKKDSKHKLEDLDKCANATPNFKSNGGGERQSDIQNENIKIRIFEEQPKSSMFERKIHGAVTKTDDVAKKLEPQTEEDLNRFIKKGHKLSIAGPEVSRQESDRGSLNAKVSKLRQKKLEQELLGIQSSIRNSLEKMLTSPASIRSQNSFSRSDWSNLTSPIPQSNAFSSQIISQDKLEDEKAEYKNRNSNESKPNAERIRLATSSQGSTESGCTPKNNEEVKHGLRLSNEMRIKDTISLETGLKLVKSPHPLPEKKQWSSVVFADEEKPQKKKYDPFSKTPLPDVKTPKSLEVVKEDTQEERTIKRERLTQVNRESKNQTQDYEKMIMGLQKEVTRLRRENRDLKSKSEK